MTSGWKPPIHIRFGLPAKIPAPVKKADQEEADKISAWMEATQIAGFTKSEADKFFGAPDPSVMEGLIIVLRTPLEARTDFTNRHTTIF